MSKKEEVVSFPKINDFRIVLAKKEANRVSKENILLQSEATIIFNKTISDWYNLIVEDKDSYAKSYSVELSDEKLVQALKIIANDEGFSFKFGRQGKHDYFLCTIGIETTLNNKDM